MTINKPSDKREYAATLAAFSLFLFMMLFRLTHSALWGDEWVEYYYSQESIRSGALYARIVSTFQPPLYNFLMHFWLKINQSILWFRLFNVVLGCITGVFLFKAIEKLTSRMMACASLIMLAVSYQWVMCIQECSEYALMLCALSAAIYFFTSCLAEFTYKRMTGFILAIVLAMYSQYGAVFVAFPLLLLFFLLVVFDKKAEVKKKIVVIASYLGSLIFFAAPLYFFFMKIQMEHNQIAGHREAFSIELLYDLPFTFGDILAYFYNLNSANTWSPLFKFAGLLLIVLAICLLKRDIGRIEKSLMISIMITYILHYFLVQLHIYAMTHPGQSAGFFERYSYFNIPLVFVVIPVIIHNCKNVYFDKRGEIITCLGIVLLALIVVISGGTTLKNWHKAYDDEFAEIWLEHEGWKDITYLYGIASYGFNYYISHSDEYKEGYLENATREVDDEALPTSFWAWRSGWSGEGWQVTIDAAKKQGYTVTIYRDSAGKGQLAFCSLE